MTGIINFFLKNTVAANLLMVFILIMGGFGLLSLKTTFFPEQELRFINIETVLPGASPEEMEEGIITKIEENLIGVTGIKETSSVSSENFGSVTVEVERGYSVDLALQDVKNAVDRINSFPRSMEPPVIFKREQLNTAYKFSISGDLDLRALKEYSRTIKDDLLTIEGISKVAISGFPAEEIEITFRENDMRALNITFDEAVSAIANTNLLSTGGTIKTDKEELLIRAKNRNYYGSELGEVVIRGSNTGGLIKLNQIATIRDGWTDSPRRSYLNDKPSVIIEVQNTIDEDMFSVSDYTKAYLDEFQQKAPQIKIDEIQDGKLYLEGRIEFIKENGLIGFLLVLILLAMFLNIRIAFWVALAIPISFAGMFVAAAYLGITINVISTFGMVVVIGILVDDGIVIAENIYQQYEKQTALLDQLRDAVKRNDFTDISHNEHSNHLLQLTNALVNKELDELQIEEAFEAEAKSIPFRSALKGTLEVLPAVGAAIITTVIAFSTFFFIEGRLGDIFGQLAIVVIFTLIFSLIEGALILPAHIAHSKALSSNKPNPITRAFDYLMKLFRTYLYGPVLKFSIHFPIPTIAICFAGLMMVVGAFSGGLIKGTFFPFVPRDEFAVNLELPAGTREDQVSDILAKIETAAWEVNEDYKEKYFNGEGNVIEKIQKTVGPGINVGKLDFYLMKGENRDSVKNRMITAAIRKKLGPVPEAERLNFGLGNVFGTPVSISLLSSDEEQLLGAVDEFKNQLKLISELRDIEDNNKLGLKEVSIELKPKAYNLGFTIGDIIRTVRQGFFGAEIQRLQRGVDEVKVWVRYALEDRSSLNDLGNMRIRTPNGQSIPLKHLAEFKIERGIVNIFHINGQREIRVTADVSSDNAAISDINSDIQNELLPKVLAKYPSVRVGIEGQAKSSAEAAASMQAVLPLILLCMFFVIVLTFSSVSQAMIVFFLIPFGFIGVGFGHWMMDKPYSLLSTLGVIALIGILVNDALVFIATFNDKIKEGLPFKQALMETGLSRFRPIVLTTITTVVGLMPLLLEKSVQAQFLIPMAISVAFGLIISTFILLVLIPALISTANGIRRVSFGLWTGKTYNANEVEPAYPGREHPWILTLIFALITLALLAGLVYGSIQFSAKLIT